MFAGREATPCEPTCYASLGWVPSNTLSKSTNGQAEVNWYEPMEYEYFLMELMHNEFRSLKASKMFTIRFQTYVLCVYAIIVQENCCQNLK